MSKILSSKWWLLSIIFVLGLIINLPSIYPSHSLDGYCNMNMTALETTKLFFNSARIFSGLFLGIAGHFQLDKIIPSISILLALVVLTIAIYLVYKNVVKWRSVDSNLKKVLILMTSFLIFYNPFMLEILVFDETFIICLGILFCVLGAIAITKDGKREYLKAIIYGVLSVLCYQGIVGYFAVFSLLFVLLSGKENILKKAIKAVSIYVGSLAISLLLVMLFGFIFGSENSHLGQVDILLNLKTIFLTQIPDIINNAFGFINPKIFIATIIFMIILHIIFCIRERKLDFYFILLLVLAFVVSILPNVFAVHDTNYIAARMSGTIGMLPGLLGIYLIASKNFSENKFIFTSLIIVVLSYFIYNSYNFLSNTYMNLKRYNLDMTELSEVHKRVDAYETETNKQVKIIYYAYDDDSAYYYNLGKNNGLSIRLLAVDWAVACAINAYSDANYKYVLMSEEKKKEYFGNKNFDSVNDSQFVFVDEKLYMLIY